MTNISLIDPEIFAVSKNQLIIHMVQVIFCFLLGGSSDNKQYTHRRLLKKRDDILKTFVPCKRKGMSLCFALNFT